LIHGAAVILCLVIFDLLLGWEKVLLPCVIVSGEALVVPVAESDIVQ
jgi:hypothetical protein